VSRWNTAVKQADFSKRAVDNDTPPMEVLEDMLPGVIRIIGGDPAKLSTARPKPGGARVALRW
jgi:hypothetical protein